VIAPALALLAAAANALSSVLQRKAARDEPQDEAFSLALVLHLLRRPVWQAGIGALIAGFLLQAFALDRAPLSLVQPLLVAELPFTLVLATRLLHAHAERRSWIGVLTMAGGLALLLVAASPSGGKPQSTGIRWVLAIIAAGATLAVVVGVGRVTTGALRAAVLATGAGIAFALTAAFMKEAVRLLSHGVLAMLASWAPWAMVFTGLLSLLLLQNAFHAGTLVAAQPAVTISDPLVSIVLGVLLFSETLRGAWWLVPELLGVGALVAGTLELARSPAIAETV
jgi:drug/metabolite transporter (DMT)-like permease